MPRNKMHKHLEPFSLLWLLLQSHILWFKLPVLQLDKIAVHVLLVNWVNCGKGVNFRNNVLVLGIRVYFFFEQGVVLTMSDTHAQVKVLELLKVLQPLD